MSLLVFAGPVRPADRTTVAKVVHASSGPWVVTLSLNDAYPYGGGQAEPALFSAADGLAFQPGDVLTIRYDSGLWCAGTYVSTSTCVDADGYRIYAPSNDQPYGTTGIYAPSRYIAPASFPVYLMQLVGAFADSRGQLVGAPFKIGKGPVDVTIPAGAAQLQLGANMYAYSDARDYYTPLKASVTGTTLQARGSMPHLAAGGPWKTTIVLQNLGTRDALARLSFYGNDGKPLPLPLAFPASAAAPATLSALDRTLAPGAALAILAGSETQPLQEGWAQLTADGSITGFAIFGMKSAGFDQEAVVPLETRGASSYLLWFDDTASMTVGVALANLTAAPVSVDVTVRDESGQLLWTGPLGDPLPAQGHTSFVLPDRFPQTAQRRGTVEFHTPATGQIGVLGLRFNPGAFTTIPVAAR
jgi:hypothetical protein